MMKKNLLTFLTSLMVVTACSETPAAVLEKYDSQLPEGTFENSSGLFHGDIYLKGFSTVTVATEPYCLENCREFDYVGFKILAGGNKDFLTFLDETRNEQNPDPFGFGIGCLFKDNISYTNHSDEHGMKQFELTKELTGAIMNADEQHPIVLHLQKLPVSAGQGAPACYSHFTTVEVYLQEI
ncbi:MAG: hypothetical protein Q8P95_00200 [bacterium]|nr:hypothetical protein [bacterium]